MPEQNSLESPLATATATAKRRQPLLSTKETSSAPTNHCVTAEKEIGSRRGSRIGETAGECAAVCCCCPCAMVHLLLLAVYRLPTSLWRKKKRKRLLRKKRKDSSEEKENQRKRNSFGFHGGDEAEAEAEAEEEESTDGDDYRVKNDAVDWDNEMWGRFYGAGFWRSSSQKKDDE